MAVLKALPIVIDEIVTTHDRIQKFWSKSHGWAPQRAADLLSAARLDWLPSLARCLKSHCEEQTAEIADGMLILGWAALGALTEGAMKFFLCVYASDYARQFLDVKPTKRNPEPDGLMFEGLKQFFMQKIWDDNEKERWKEFLDMVQQGRNAIHAFKDRDIGDLSTLEWAIRTYQEFIDYVHESVPYPDDSYRFG